MHSFVVGYDTVYPYSIGIIGERPDYASGATEFPGSDNLRT